MMKIRSLAQVFAGGLLVVFAQPAQADRLAELDRLVGRWLALREAVAAEKRGWHEQRAAWLYEQELLERERAKLQDSLDAEALRRQATAEAIDSARTSVATGQARLEAMIPVVHEMEAHLRRMRLLIPFPLAPELANELTVLAGETIPADGRTLVRRMQRALGLMAEVERFQNRIHTGRETVTIDGARRELETLYFGMGQAYGIAPDNSRTATAIPTADGWHWRYTPQPLAQIRTAITIVNREAPARLVTLPLQVRP